MDDVELVDELGTDDSELMQVGQEIINLVSEKTFQVFNKMGSTTLSIGAASLGKEMNSENNKSFDFKLWLKKCEAGLNAAKSLNIKNNTNESRCCIGKGTDSRQLSAISSVSNDSASVVKMKTAHESSFSLLASAASGPIIGSSDSTANLKLDQTSMMASMASVVHHDDNDEQPNYNSLLTMPQLHSSIRLYDKLSRMDSSTSIVRLSIFNRFVKQGANFNFQNPRDKQNTLLMLCCMKNFDILIKYICTKHGNNSGNNNNNSNSNDGVNFDIQNENGSNALMIAVLHVKDDKTVAMIAQNTKNKNTMTNVCLCFIF